MIKRGIICVFLIVITAVLLPGLLVKRFKTEETASTNVENILENNNNAYSNYNYSDYSEIKLYHSKTKQVETIPIDEYLLGVVAAEMPAEYDEEALKAQSVVARTYTIYTIINNDGKHDGADICDESTCCQAWISKEDRIEKWKNENRENNWEKIEDAVFSTQGQIITYDGNPINAFFHANSGGKTEEVSNVWGGENLPYLKTVQTSGEDVYSQYSSEACFTKEEFIIKIKETHPDFEIDFSNKNCIRIEEYTEGDRVKKIKIGNTFFSGVEIRKIFGLKSANFDFKTDENNITFFVKGYGHGVGMSQTGADLLAKEGKNYKEIIEHFYTDVEITNI